MHLTHAQTRASPTIQTFTNNGNYGILSHDFRICSKLLGMKNQCLNSTVKFRLNYEYVYSNKNVTLPEM